MKIEAPTALNINLLSRSAPDTLANQQRILSHLAALLDKASVQEAPRPLALDPAAGFQRRDKNFFEMTFLAREAGGGVLIFNIKRTSAEVLCRFPDGKIYATNRDAFPDDQLRLATAFTPSPPGGRKLVYRFSVGRPLDSLTQIMRVLREARQPPHRDHALWLNRNQIFFDPIRLFSALGATAHEIGAAEARGAHVVEFSRNLIDSEDLDLLHQVYRPQAIPDYSRIFITLEVEKRIWREQEDALGKFLTRARTDLGRPLTVYINGMGASVNGSTGGDFGDIEEAETQAVERLAQRAPGDTQFLRGFGKTIDTKIEECRNYGFFLGPLGTSSLVPIIMDLPGITYHNRFFIDSNTMFQGHQVTRLGIEHIRNLDGFSGIAPKFDDKQNVGYSIDADFFAETAMTHFCKVRAASPLLSNQSRFRS